MLNRLYIVVGVIVILALTAAFVVPALIPWTAYRDRMEAAASGLVGTPVRIAGDIRFTLLPEPKLEFTKVSAGEDDAPVVSVEEVTATFSLVDFIRDRYVITRLELDGPVVNTGIDTRGRLTGGIALEPPSAGNVAVASAVISDGSLNFVDARSGTSLSVGQVAGDLKIDAAAGTVVFNGAGQMDGIRYSGRISASPGADSATTRLALFLRPGETGLSFSADGILLGGSAPAFTGAITYRQPPPVAARVEDAGQGDLLVSGKITATPQRVLLSDYTVTPDENRPATRLTGAAEIALGERPSFNAVVSGGVIAQPPRDATAEQSADPYEVLRLLGELPAAPVLSIPGRIGVDIAELGLRAATLRNVRIDAVAGTDGWSVQRFAAQLPGETTLTLAGNVTAMGARAEFAGTVEIESKRLDALSTLWRKPAPGSPLFGLPGRLTADVALVGETLSVSDGRLTIDGKSQSFSAQIGIGAIRDIHVAADLGTLDAEGSAALFALLPDIPHDPGFAASFASGEFKLIADAITVDGLAARSLSASGSWEGGVLVVDNLAALEFGGVRFDTSFTAFGSFAKPELSGAASLNIPSAQAPALQRFYDLINAPAAVTEGLAKSFPADLAMQLEAPNGDGAQSLMLSGSAGTAEIGADAELEAGLVGALGGKIELRFEMKSADPDAMTAQLGLGDTSIVGATGPLHLVGVVKGELSSSLETTLLLEGGGDSLGFSGHIEVSDPEAIAGKGTVKARVGEPDALAALLGAPGLQPPGFAATAGVEFTGLRSVRLEHVEGSSGGAAFSGTLSLRQAGATRVIAGDISAGRTDLDGWLRVLAGPAALLRSDTSIWPDGPFDTGSAPRSTTGSITVRTPAIQQGGRTVVSDASADFEWDATGAHLRNFHGDIKEGTIDLELSVCCAGPLPAKQVSGRIALDGVNLDDVLPAAVAAAFDGVLDGSGRFDGTGDSVAAVLGALTGEGTYRVSNFRIAGLDAAAPGSITATTEGLLEMEAAGLTALITDRLDDGAFDSAAFTGGFTVAGGVVRSPNVSVDGEEGSLFGSLSVRLADLGLSGDYVLGSTTLAPASRVDAASAKIVVRVGGTVNTPERSFDVSALVDAVMVEAYEAEVARLEKLKAEDDARRKAEAEEQARLAAEAAARKAAEDAARKAAEEAAARKAAEEAAARAAAEQRPIGIGQGLTLELPPPRGN